MLFIYPSPQYPRRNLEYVFKSLYMLVSGAHVISLIVLISDFWFRLEQTMPTYFTQKQLLIAPAVRTIMEGCTHTANLHLGSVEAPNEVSLASLPIGLMTMAQYVTGLVVLEFLLLVNNAICHFNYTTGNRHLRVCGVHIPLYHILVTFTYTYSIVIVTITWTIRSSQQFYADALERCAANVWETNQSVLLEAEYDGMNVFTTAIYWPFAATCFGLLIYLMAAAVLCWNSASEGVLLLSQANAPWESSGPLCFTSKSLLRLHTAQRNAIEEDAHNAIKQGQSVRIVRTYQLMTEEDFNAVVQAMRDQVAEILKEEQFQRLQENFGERESQIDEGGFVWRQMLQEAPPAAPQEATYVDVPFENYFTDGSGNGAAAAVAEGHDTDDMFSPRNADMYPVEEHYFPGGASEEQFVYPGQTLMGDEEIAMVDNSRRKRKHRRPHHRPGAIEKRQDDVAPGNDDSPYLTASPGPRVSAGGGLAERFPVETHHRRRGGHRGAEQEPDEANPDELSEGDLVHFRY